MADQILDELVPEGLDWERLVRTYPLPSILLAALGGFMLGRTRGTAIIAALSSFAASQVARNVNELLGQDAL